MSHQDILLLPCHSFLRKFSTDALPQLNSEMLHRWKSMRWEWQISPLWIWWNTWPRNSLQMPPPSNRSASPINQSRTETINILCHTAYKTEKRNMIMNQIQLTQTVQQCTQLWVQIDVIMRRFIKTTSYFGDPQGNIWGNVDEKYSGLGPKYDL